MTQPSLNEVRRDQSALSYANLYGYPQASPHFEKAQRNQYDRDFPKPLILLDKTQMRGCLRWLS
jgi:hypothetical protein